MASDTAKKKKTATETTKKSTKKTTTASKTVKTPKKSTSTKNTTKKTSKTTKVKKTVAPKKIEEVVKSTPTAKKNKNGKTSRVNKIADETKKTNPIEIEDLEQREADLAKTIILNPEVIQELHNEEFEVPDIDNIKIEEPNVKEKKSKKKNDQAARTILGMDLPSNMTIEDRRERKKFYVKDAFIFAIIIPILDLFAMLFIDSYTYLMITTSVPLNYLITLLLDFILIFIVTYLIDYIFGEDAVKRMNR